VKNRAANLVKIFIGVVIFSTLAGLLACSSGTTGTTAPTAQTSNTQAGNATSSSSSVATKPATPAASAPAAVGGKGSISARVDGSAWTSTVTAAQYSNGSLIISGADTSSPTRAFGLGVTAGAPGTYQATLPSPAASASWTVGSATWQASLVGGSGSVTITSLTSTGASGTFSFSLVPIPGTSASGNKTVTDGTFNVTFAAAASIPAASQAGRAAMTATVNGQAWNGQFKISASWKNQFLSMVVFDGSSATITFGIGNVSAPGTYSLAFGNPQGSSAIYTNGAGQGWGTAFQGGSGSIVITNITAGGAAGTFSFDAVPATGGGGGTIHVTNGQFDLTF
jgi:hypothetical protein